MSVSNRVRGFAHERDLARKLWNLGFAVIRAPASGSKTKRIIYPDIIAIKNEKVFVFEAKTISEEKTVYIPVYKIDRLKEFLKRSGGRGFIAIKVIGTGEWRLISIDKIERCSDKFYRVDIDRYITLSELDKLAGKGE